MSAATQSLDEQIDFFFAPPVPEQPLGTRSTLHAVRREMQDCYVGAHFEDEFEPLRVPAENRRRVFATCLVLWAGYDLLAKFYAGDMSVGKVERRFTAFMREVVLIGGSPDLLARTPGILYYGLRNPMVHAFGFSSGKTYTVVLATGDAQHVIWTVEGVPDAYVVSLPGLYATFIHAVSRYRERLAHESTLRDNFARVFPNIGSMGFSTSSGPATR